MPERIPWIRVLVEGAVIVGSILLAFAIDASWERRQDRAQTEDQVEALVQEFRQAQEELRVEIRGVESSREGSAAVLALMDDARRDVTPEGLDALLLKSFSVGIFTTQHPVMTMMLASGDVVELQNDSLVYLLGSWQDQVEHLRLDSQHLERNREETIFGRSVSLGIPLSPTPSLLRILDDSGMEAAFTFREDRARRLADAYRDALDTAEEIVRVLQGAL